MASWYDVALAPGLRDRIRRVFAVHHLLDWQEALESLLNDPSEINPFVTSASAVHGYQQNEYVMLWEN